MKCNKIDRKTGEKCKGDLIPFGRAMFGYYKCTTCDKLHVIKEKQVTLTGRTVKEEV